ncbi:MAG: N-6 DNA methylase [Polyangiaceae bacterium]|nr:N-6 DNA methylase [Polyangiaceae bacterium]
MAARTGSGSRQAEPGAGRGEASGEHAGLRRAVEAALGIFAQGYLAHPENTALRDALRTGRLGAAAFCEELLTLVHRQLFRLAVEERGVAHPAGSFGPAACPTLDAAALDDAALRRALEALSSPPGPAGPEPARRRDLEPEALGAVYEALLEREPRVEVEACALVLGASDATKDHARRTSGSYYTPDDLVRVLLDRALEPLVADTVAAHPDAPAEALLELAIVDPACGSGHFLCAAARRLASHVARLRAPGPASAGDERRALREVVARSVHGVDRSALAVELCRARLWLEVAEPGPPLAQDAHIHRGDALLGWGAAGQDTESPARRHRLDWRLAFPEVFARGGFDLVLGNPPWIAHAGRAAQPLPEGVKAFYRRAYPSFAGYPTTHGLFVTLAARLLRPGGRLGLVVPSSLSELAGYEPTRRAHDELCAFPAELVDFGEGRFPGVTQPCMALVSRRLPGGRTDAPPGEPWPVERPDLDATARGLLARLAALPPLPPELFGERGVQSDPALRAHFRRTSVPRERFDTPIREGTDVRELVLLPPRFHVDRAALGRRIRPAEEFQAVRIVVRQTARYPIAALADGVAFRNSLLAVFDSDTWPAAALVALLNSALVRYLHYQRFRDARQPVMPQVKIGHLRAIPAPPCPTPEALARLAEEGARLSLARTGPGRARTGPCERRALDALVADLYGLDAAERAAVGRWHDEHGPRG